MKQKSFFKTNEFPTEFGGELLKNKRKSKRPLSTKKAMHNVLRADIRTSGSFLKQRNVINHTIDKCAEHFNVKIYKKGIARDHIHLVTKVEDREDYNNFVRALTGILAKLLKFKWLYRPYSKVLEWGRHFKRACDYVLQNELEGLGLVPYRERGRRKRRLDEL